MNQETKDIIKATAPVLAVHGYAITTRMYKTLSEEQPDAINLFNKTHLKEKEGKRAQQPTALAAAVHAYAANIDNLDAISSSVEKIAQKHVSLGVVPAQYKIIGEYLLKAIKHVLGEAATPEIMAAWEIGYNFLAQIFINREKEIAGDSDWKPYKLHEILDEAVLTKSFVFKPVEGQVPEQWQAGQYAGFRFKLENGETIQRNYTLSCAPNREHIRITLKKDEAHGIGSVYLHSLQVGKVLDVSIPCGCYVFEPEKEPTGKPKKLVLMSAGIGITPHLSLVESLLEKGREVVMLMQWRDESFEVKKDWLEKLQGEKGKALVVKSYFSRPKEGEGKKFGVEEIEGMVGDLDEAVFYMCGPSGWMTWLREGLLEKGVDKDNMHCDFFVPSI